MSAEPGSAEALIEHMTECLNVDAAIVCDKGINGDEVIATLLAAGWTWDGTADVVSGKRIRVLRAPDVRQEPAPFEHSEMCEDGDDGEPPEDLLHLDPHDGGCLCTCPKCGDSDGYCICPQCSRPASHPHAAVTP